MPMDRKRNPFYYVADVLGVSCADRTDEVIAENIMEALRHEWMKLPIDYDSQPVWPDECIEAIKSVLGPELFLGFLWGNAIKYLWRWPRKGLEEDLEKCAEYIARIKDEGYTMPAWYDGESGCMLPNPALAMLNCGDCVDECFAEADKNKSFAR